MSADSEPAEIQALRRSLRDLLALSALPALWVGQTPEWMLESLADALHGMLMADIVYTRLGTRREPLSVPVVRTGSGADSATLDQLLEGALQQWETESGQLSLVPSLCTAGNVRLSLWSLGADGSVLAVGASRPDFPTQHEHLLLRVAANEGAIALKSALLLAVSERARIRAEAALQAL